MYLGYIFVMLSSSLVDAIKVYHNSQRATDYQYAWATRLHKTRYEVPFHKIPTLTIGYALADMRTRKYTLTDADTLKYALTEMKTCKSMIKALVAAGSSMLLAIGGLSLLSTADAQTSSSYLSYQLIYLNNTGSFGATIMTTDMGIQYTMTFSSPASIYGVVGNYEISLIGTGSYLVAPLSSSESVCIIQAYCTNCNLNSYIDFYPDAFTVSSPGSTGSISVPATSVDILPTALSDSYENWLLQTSSGGLYFSNSMSGHGLLIVLGVFAVMIYGYVTVFGISVVKALKNGPPKPVQ